LEGKRTKSAIVDIGGVWPEGGEGEKNQYPLHSLGKRKRGQKKKKGRNPSFSPDFYEGERGGSVQIDGGKGGDLTLSQCIC